MRAANVMAQVGPVSYLPPSGRRGIDPDDIAWARAKRAAGWGWQAIALARRLNQTDLMLACGALEKAAAAMVVGAAPAPERWIAPDNAALRVRVLAAIASGRNRPGGVCEAVDRTPDEVKHVVKDCKSAGLVEGNAREAGGWRVTGRGYTLLAERGVRRA